MVKFSVHSLFYICTIYNCVYLLQGKSTTTHHEDLNFYHDHHHGYAPQNNNFTEHQIWKCTNQTWTHASVSKEWCQSNCLSKDKPNSNVSCYYKNVTKTPITMENHACSCEKKIFTYDHIVRFVNPKTDTNTLSSEERKWIEARDKKIKLNWEIYFKNLNLPKLKFNEIDQSKLPRVAICSSGGGTRAMLAGAGAINAMDIRDQNSKDKKSGGLFQVSSYFIGLSGSSWLISSLLANNFPLPTEWANNDINLNTSLFYPGETDEEAIKNYAIFDKQIQAKKDAGYGVSLVDLWGRGVSYQMLNNFGAKGSYGVDFSLSDFAQDKTNPFYYHDIPFPMILGSQLFRNESKQTAEPWEMTLFEVGSFSKNVSAFIKTENFGTKLQSTLPQNDDGKITHMDQFGFMFGISSAAFALPDASQDPMIPLPIRKILQKYENVDSTFQNLTLAEVPNSFLGINDNSPKNISTEENLYFGDGGLGPWGNLPLTPLLISEREIDVILTIDSSNDEDGYPNGAAIVSAQEYATIANLPFPQVPTKRQFAQNNRALLNRVSFFGCYEHNIPTIVYIPNHYVSFPTNTSTSKFDYNYTEINGFLENGQEIINSQPGFEDLPECLGCLMGSYIDYKSEQCTQ
eukprot:Pgem_evm1s17174